jgi:hypothetical protein
VRSAAMLLRSAFGGRRRQILGRMIFSSMGSPPRRPARGGLFCGVLDRVAVPVLS